MILKPPILSDDLENTKTRNNKCFRKFLIHTK